MTIPSIRHTLGVLAFAAAPVTLVAQATEPIKDNSFLIEEAYNQEAGVVQHISTFTQPPAGQGWAYGFTQEWPVRTVRHQLSYTIPVLGGAGTAVGDIALNYRFQAAGASGGRLAFAPRLSILFASGDPARGFGAGGTGVQANLPLSVELTPRIVVHGNVGATHVPRRTDGFGATAATTALAAGGSVVWLAHPRVNALVETLWGSDEEVTGPGTTDRSSSLVIAPGIRWSHDHRSGLQIVPGIAYALGVGPSAGDDALLLYLSLEHPFHR